MGNKNMRNTSDVMMYGFRPVFLECDDYEEGIPHPDYIEFCTLTGKIYQLEYVEGQIKKDRNHVIARLKDIWLVDRDNGKEIYKNSDIEHILTQFNKITDITWE